MIITKCLFRSNRFNERFLFLVQNRNFTSHWQRFALICSVDSAPIRLFFFSVFTLNYVELGQVQNGSLRKITCSQYFHCFSSGRISDLSWRQSDRVDHWHLVYWTLRSVCRSLCRLFGHHSGIQRIDGKRFYCPISLLLNFQNILNSIIWKRRKCAFGFEPPSAWLWPFAFSASRPFASIHESDSALIEQSITFSACQYLPIWEFAEQNVAISYAANGSYESTPGVVGLRIGLGGVNITLDVRRNAEHDSIDSLPIVQLNEHFSWEWDQGRKGFGVQGQLFSRFTLFTNAEAT